MMNTTISTQASRRHLFYTLSCMICLLAIFASVMFVAPEAAFCADDTAAGAIESAVTEMATQIYTTMRKVITPIAIVCFAYAGFQFVCGGKGGTEKARVGLIGGVVAIMLVVFAPLIGREVSGWVADFGGGGLAGFNSLAGGTIPE